MISDMLVLSGSAAAALGPRSSRRLIRSRADPRGAAGVDHGRATSYRPAGRWNGWSELTRLLSAVCTGRPLLVLETPPRADVVAGVAVGVALEVVLVLGLGLPEWAGRRDLGDDLARP